MWTDKHDFIQPVPHLKPVWLAFNRAGAPNSALQCYSDKNVSVSGSMLNLTANLVPGCGCQSFDLTYANYVYSASYVMMRTFNFLYGVIELRAKLGGGTGTGCWPVIWLEDVSCQASDPTGTDGTCNGQEIDMVEILSSDYTQINQQIHVTGNHNDQHLQTGYSDPSTNFHIYKLTWSAGSLVWNIDGTDTFTITQAYVPNAAMYLKFMYNTGYLNGAVTNASLPWTMQIDYVKVSQNGAVVFYDDFDS